MSGITLTGIRYLYSLPHLPWKLKDELGPLFTFLLCCSPFREAGEFPPGEGHFPGGIEPV